MWKIKKLVIKNPLNQMIGLMERLRIIRYLSRKNANQRSCSFTVNVS